MSTHALTKKAPVIPCGGSGTRLRQCSRKRHRASQWKVLRATAEATRSSRVFLLAKDQCTHTHTGDVHRLSNPGKLHLETIVFRPGSYMGKEATARLKASSPAHLYGATKMASDKLFVAGNSYAGADGSKFSVVRCSNVMGSRGSVIPFLLSQKGKGSLPVTDTRMTRFMITLEQGVELVWHAFEDMEGGEIYVKKIPSMKVTDIARAVRPDAEHEIVGIRPGEKLHEQMISPEDAHHTYEYPQHFKILPAIHSWHADFKRIKDGQRVRDGFTYASDTNTEWMDVPALQSWIATHQDRIGRI